MSDACHRAPYTHHFVEKVEKPDGERELQRYKETHPDSKRIDSDGQSTDGIQRLCLEILTQIVETSA